MKKRCSIFLAILTAASLLLSGCESGVDFLMNNTEETETTTTSTDIYMPIENVRTLNPVVSKDEDTYYIDKLIYEGLFALDETLQAQPLLAQSYSYEDDGYSVLITLKQGVYWHDGEAFQADDVKFSIDSYLSVLYSNLSLYNSYVDNIKSARVRDDHTIQIYFKNNSDVAVEKLTFPIIPKHKFKNVNAVKNSTEKFVPVGTGPYKAESVDVNKEIVLTANQSYHGDGKAQNRVCFRVLPDRLDAVNLFDINDLTTTFSKNIDRDTLVNNKDVQLVSFPSNEVEMIGFNCQRTALADPLVRKALACTVNVDEILETGYYNSGVRSDNLYYPGYLGVDSTEKLLSVDIGEAKKLLEQAGYLDRDGNGFVESAAGDEISIEILVNQEDGSRTAAAQIVRDGFSKLPIHVTVEQTDWDSYSAKVASKNYDVYIGGYRIQDNFDLRFLLHSAGGNPAGYVNPELDQLLDTMESGVTAAEKRSAFKSVRNILTEETPYYCMFYKTYGLISAKGLTGTIRPYFVDPYNGCEDWTVTYKLKNQILDSQDQEQEPKPQE